MLYLAVVFAFLLLLAAVLVIALSPAPMPDFTLKAPAGEEKLRLKVLELAKNSREYRSGGTGLPIRVLRKRLNAAYSVLKKKNEAGLKLSDYECALFDNFRKIQEITESLYCSRAEFTDLPHVDGLPRLYKLSELMVKHCDGYVTEEIVKNVVSLFNSECPLLFDEVKCFGAVFAYALTEFITIYASKLTTLFFRYEKGMRDAARERVDVRFLRSMGYVAALYSNAGDKLKNQLRKLCLDNGFDVSDRIDGFYSFTALYNVSVSAAVKTMYSLSEWMSDEFVLSLSPIDEYFLSCDGLDYGSDTLTTRRLYLSKVAEKALKSGRSELSVAAEASARASAEKRSLAYFLLPRERGRAFMRLFIFIQLLFAAGISAAVYFVAPVFKIAAALLSAPISLMTANRIVSFFSAAAAQKRTLPYRDIKSIPDTVGANIVCSRLIASKAEAEEAVFMLECAARANPDRRFSYTLLIDLLSSDSETSPEDREILDALDSSFSGLKGDRFNLLVRKRSFLKEKKRYQGREKKRGALLDLNGLILRHETFPFRLIKGSTYSKKYVIALDSDTLLNCATELVEIMEHPYNAEKNVVSLRMNATPESASETLFARVFCGAAGLNAYTCHHNDVHSDVFGAGNYTGKGIYRVREFDAAVSGAFMDNRIVSHDFLEGAYAGCVECDETALDTFPASYAAFNTRNLRWLRGDWQLLPWLFPFVRNKKGERTVNPLSPIAKWHIFTNIFFSLAPAASLTLIILSLFASGTLSITLTALLYYAVCLLLLLPSVASCPKSAAKNTFAILFEIAVLPVTAVCNLWSAALTLLRLIRRKNLLEWRVFAHSGEDSGVIVMTLLGVAFAVLIANMFLYGHPALYALSALFLTGVPLQAFMSDGRRDRSVSPVLEGYLSLIAAKTWNYFAESCTEEYNFLPPDNFCELDGKGFCSRTSPTNIGMALVAAFSAMKLKIIDSARAAAFISPIIETVVRMEKWQGNLYNWYDIKSLKPLYPEYVSSVDSGNLLCALMLAGTFADRATKYKIDALIENCRLQALYDEERGLMRIGWSGAEKRFDGYYDLAASEASICYLTAIGLNKIPRAAWNNLGVRGVKYAGRKTLYSWTGGAFEYLMTPIFYYYGEGTLYRAAASNAVRAQISYARKKRLRYWGVSESQYLAYEDNGDYKYRAFGVPGIALSEYSEGSAVSPYSCLLSLKFAPREAEADLAAYLENKLLGKYGLYEAADNDGVVRSFMAHHQGMSLGAICNFMCSDAIVRELRGLPQVRAAEMLLSRPATFGRVRKKGGSVLRKAFAQPARYVSSARVYPTLGLFGAGDYKVVIDERGRGFSVVNDLVMTRKRHGCGFLVYAETADGEADIAGGTDAYFAPDYAEYKRSFSSLEATVTARTLTCVPGEIRKAVVRNKGDSPVRLTLRAAAEPVLDEHRHDLAHREYNNMFVTTAATADGLAVYACRKKTSAYLALRAFGGDEVAYETSRHEFYNRSKCVKTGSVLDPVLAASVRLELAPGQESSVVFALISAFSEQELNRRLSLVASRGFFDRDSAYLSADRFIDAETSSVASRLLYGAFGCYKSADIGVNSAYPTLAVEVCDERAVSRAEYRLSRCKLLYDFGIKFNLFVVYREKYGYLSGIFNAVNAAVDRVNLRRSIPCDCVFGILNSDSDSDRVNKILSAALNWEQDNPERKSGIFVAGRPYKNAELKPPELALKMGRGGFLHDGSYWLDVSVAPAPKPWSNIVAGKNFGTLMTDSGGGYTYCGNSRENKLTVWSNDSALDPSSERVLLGERGIVWSVTRSPVLKDCSYTALHSFGFTVYTCNYNGIVAELTEFIGRTDVKYYSLDLLNAEEEARTLDVALAVDTVLGDFAEYTACSVSGTYEDGEIIMRNAVNGALCRVGASIAADSYSFSRKSMLNKYGEYSRLSDLEVLEGNSAVYAASVSIAPGGKKNIVFWLSAGAEAHPELAAEILAESKKYYSSLSPVTLESGDASLDFLYKWLPYQTLCSRFFARTGFYQAGGAYGFRDQLQDALAVMYIDSSLTREHILECAAHQFEKGDVQHWWHPPCSGVRTRFVDDRLFLPLATAEYIAFTGDSEILSERVAYLIDTPLPDNMKTLYNSPGFTEHTGSLLEHCKKAIFSTEIDSDGLVLMKGGDWNDAMDEVGAKGRGTTVFGTMLLYLVVKSFQPYVTFPEEKEQMCRLAETLKAAAETQWDGEWYRRAVTDDGLVLGSAESRECKIDLLSQAFAVLSGIAPAERAELALISADNRLTDEKNGLIALLAPPFKRSKGVGYIADYPEGVRENGGQYTHAAIWYIMALFKTGRYNRAYKLLEMINPINHSRTAVDVQRYKNEPYVMSADVYTGQHAGEGGWSWYTGAAGWMYKCVTESLLGIEFKGDSLKLNPRLPDETRSLSFSVRRGECNITVTVDNTARDGDWRFSVGGVTYNSDTLRLFPSLNGKNIVISRIK